MNLDFFIGQKVSTVLDCPAFGEGYPEGAFYYQVSKDDPPSGHFSNLKAIQNAIRSYRICSLSSTFDSHLLWAHYAEGFRGIAIEVDIPDGDENIQPLRSRGVFASLQLTANIDVEAEARSIMLSKHHEWAYEKEIRILHNAEYYYLPSPVSRIIVGQRMNGALFNVLNVLCSNLGIVMNRIGIGDTGLDADYVNPQKTFERKVKGD